MNNCHKWGGKLTGCGFRLTSAREAILETLTNTDKHLSAEDIYISAHAENPAGMLFL